jgi:hypothetical protein
MTIHRAPDDANIDFGDSVSHEPTEYELEAAELEAAELASLRTRVERGVARIAPLLQQAINTGKINPMSLETAELRVRLEILADAAFGDGTRDQLGYELAVQAKYTEMVKTYIDKAAEVHQLRESAARRSALLEGIDINFGPRPGGRR